MSTYRVVEHTVPCGHLREYPQCLAGEEEDVLYLAAKQYIPLDNPNPQPGDVTIFAAHANGFPKELYEPLWEDLIKQTKKRGFKIRSIWMTDIANQGASGLINEKKLGNEYGWFDHSRDLLNLINLKRDLIPRPIVAVGHSFGGAQLVNLAYFHPTLFTSMILMDPVIQLRSAEIYSGGSSIAQLSTFRRDVWPSRDAAFKSFQKSPFYKSWDSRVLDRWVEYGLRDVPTPVYPDEKSPKVTLTTPVSQEVFTFLRPNYEGYGHDNKPINRKTHADVHPIMRVVYPFYRFEGAAVFHRLPELRPSALYIFAETSTTSNADFNFAKLNRTGIGFSGSGGAKDGKVSSILLDGVGHLFPMEVVGDTARHIAEWVDKTMVEWRADREERDRKWKSLPLEEKQRVTEQWKEMMGGPPKKAMKDSKL